VDRRRCSHSDECLSQKSTSLLSFMYLFWVNFSDCAQISVTLPVHHGPEGCAQSANNRTYSASFMKMTFAMFYPDLKVQLICNLVIAAGIFGFWLCPWCLGFSPSGVIISDWRFLRSSKLSGNTIWPWSVLPETKLSQSEQVTPQEHDIKRISSMTHPDFNFFTLWTFKFIKLYIPVVKDA